MAAPARVDFPVVHNTTELRALDAIVIATDGRTGLFSEAVLSIFARSVGMPMGLEVSRRFDATDDVARNEAVSAAFARGAWRYSPHVPVGRGHDHHVGLGGLAAGARVRVGMGHGGVLAALGDAPSYPPIAVRSVEVVSAHLPRGPHVGVGGGGASARPPLASVGGGHVVPSGAVPGSVVPARPGFGSHVAPGGRASSAFGGPRP